MTRRNQRTRGRRKQLMTKLVQRLKNQ